MAPVPPPEVRRGDDVRAIAARTAAALTTANGRLGQSRAWYEGVRRQYGGAR